MNVEQLVNAMTPEVYQNLKQAVETGKWPNGAELTEEQKANSLPGMDLTFLTEMLLLLL